MAQQGRTHVRQNPPQKMLTRISILATWMGLSISHPPILDPPKRSFFLREPSLASAKRQIPPTKCWPGASDRNPPARSSHPRPSDSDTRFLQAGASGSHRKSRHRLASWPRASAWNQPAGLTAYLETAAFAPERSRPFELFFLTTLSLILKPLTSIHPPLRAQDPPCLHATFKSGRNLRPPTSNWLTPVVCRRPNGTDMPQPVSSRENHGNRETVGVQKTLQNCHPFSRHPRNPHNPNILTGCTSMCAVSPFKPSPLSPSPLFTPFPTPTWGHVEKHRKIGLKCPIIPKSFRGIL